MHTIPLNLSLECKNVLIVGGGNVALRKTRSLLETGVNLTIIAREILPELRLLASENGFKIQERGYLPGDINSIFLAIAATNDRTLNQQIGDDCKLHGVLVCIADNPSAGDCIFPATLQQGDLTVSVSTNGKCPGYSALIRDKIATSIDHRYGAILNQLSNEREKLLTDGKSRPYNRKILQSRVKELLNTIQPKEA